MDSSQLWYKITELIQKSCLGLTDKGLLSTVESKHCLHRFTGQAAVSYRSAHICFHGDISVLCAMIDGLAAPPSVPDRGQDSFLFGDSAEVHHLKVRKGRDHVSPGNKNKRRSQACL